MATDNKPNADSKNDSLQALRSLLLEDDLISRVLGEALQLADLKDLFARTLDESSVEQWCMKDIFHIIGMALKQTWSATDPELKTYRDTMHSVITKKANFKDIYAVVMFSISEKLPSGDLDSIVMGIINILMETCQLDDIILASIRHLIEPSPADTSIDAISGAMQSRQLDDILCEACRELMKSGELDEVVIHSLSEMLVSGKFDVIIFNAILVFECEDAHGHDRLSIINDRISPAVSEEVLCKVAVEVVFPSFAIFHLSDGHTRANKESLAAVASGKVYHGHGEEVVLIAGSKGERLAMEAGWGHPTADMDAMQLWGGELGVQMPFLGDEDVGISSLEYHPDGCPPAYTRLCITITEFLQNLTFVDDNCIVESANQRWLHTTNLLQAMHQVRNEVQTSTEYVSSVIKGPTSQIKGGLLEIVPTLVANAPHPAIDKYYNRPRGEWPPQHQLDEIKRQPMLLVLVGHQESDVREQQARISWSANELILMSELPIVVRQGYIACKFTFKSVLRLHRSKMGTVDGRSRVGSFHVKNTFLYFLEKTPPCKISSAYDLMVNLFGELDKYLEEGTLPHYFLPECNLLGTLVHEERQIARQAINAIISNPLAAILKSPCTFGAIYSDIHPDSLVEAFSRVAATPFNEAMRWGLAILLSRLDVMRYQRYRKQLVDDKGLCECNSVSERSELINLLNMLAQTNHLV